VKVHFQKQRENTLYGEDDAYCGIERHKRDKYDEGNRMEIGRTKQEHKHNEQWGNGNGRRDEGHKAYGDGQDKNTPLEVWILQDKCGGSPFEEVSTLTR